jgi:hypothetical protein
VLTDYLHAYSICIPDVTLLDILDTRVRFELARSTLPIDLALDKISNDSDNSIDGTDKLAGGIPFTACQLGT